MVLLVPCADEASDHLLGLLLLALVHGDSDDLLVGPLGAQVTASSLVSDYWLKPAVKVYCFYLYFLYTFRKGLGAGGMACQSGSCSLQVNLVYIDEKTLTSDYFQALMLPGPPHRTFFELLI